MTRASDQLPRDEIFDLLSNSRRRFVLSYLAEHPEGTTLQELSRQIAALENEQQVEDVSATAEKRVYVSLYQTHVPRLVQAGVIRREDDRIVRTERARQVYGYLGESTDEDRPWYWYYLGMVVVSGFIALSVAFDISVFKLVEEELLVSSIFACFGLLTAIYILSRKDVRNGFDGALI